MIRSASIAVAAALAVCSSGVAAEPEAPAPSAGLQRDIEAAPSLVQPAATRPSVELSLRPAAPGEGAGVVPAPAAPNVRIDSRMPSLRLSTTGPDTIVVGEPAAYELSLANEDDAEARDVAVLIGLPPWVELQSAEATSGAVQQEGAGNRGRLVWSVDRIAGGAQQAASLVLLPREGRAFELAVGLSMRPKSSAKQIAIREAKLGVQLDGPENFVVGQTAAWTATLTNPGSGDARDVTLSLYADGHPLGNLEIGRIEAGGRRTVDVALRSAEPGTGRLRAVAAGAPGLKADAGGSFLARQARLLVNLHGSHFEYAGTEPSYEVAVRNVGDAKASDVTVRLSLPQGARYAGGLEAEAADVSSTGVQWSVEGIEPGAEKVFRIACELRREAEHRFVAEAATAGALHASDSFITRTKAVADLKLEVLDPQGPRAVGDDAEFELRVVNRGTATARQIRITAACPPELEPVGLGAEAAVASGQIFFRPLARLEPGEEIVRRVTVRTGDAGAHLFRVLVTCGDPELRLASEQTVRFFLRPAPQQDLARPAMSSEPERIDWARREHGSAVRGGQPGYVQRLRPLVQTADRPAREFPEPKPAAATASRPQSRR